MPLGANGRQNGLEGRAVVGRQLDREPVKTRDPGDRAWGGALDAERALGGGGMGWMGWMG